MPSTMPDDILPRYPIEVLQQLNTLTDLVLDVLTPTAIYLLGSAARGELSWFHHTDGSLELFSDLEFMVVTHRRPTPIQRKTINDHLPSLEQQVCNLNPLFHIDILFREQRRLSSLPRFYLHL